MCVCVCVLFVMIWIMLLVWELLAQNLFKPHFMFSRHNILFRLLIASYYMKFGFIHANNKHAYVHIYHSLLGSILPLKNFQIRNFYTPLNVKIVANQPLTIHINCTHPQISFFKVTVDLRPMIYCAFHGKGNMPGEHII